MLVVIVCSVLALCGLALMVLWGRFSLTPPDAAGAPAPTEAAPPVPALPARPPLTRRLATALRRYWWWATVVTVASVATTLLWTLPAARLIMRALALTSPDAAGRSTEAHAIVGTISVDGTCSCSASCPAPSSAPSCSR